MSFQQLPNEIKDKIARLSLNVWFRNTYGLPPTKLTIQEFEKDKFNDLLNFCDGIVTLREDQSLFQPRVQCSQHEEFCKIIKKLLQKYKSSRSDLKNVLTWVLVFVDLRMSMGGYNYFQIMSTNNEKVIMLDPLWERMSELLRMSQNTVEFHPGIGNGGKRRIMPFTLLCHYPFYRLYDLEGEYPTSENVTAYENDPVNVRKRLLLFDPTLHNASASRKDLYARVFLNFNKGF